MRLFGRSTRNKSATISAVRTKPDLPIKPRPTEPATPANSLLAIASSLAVAAMSLAPNSSAQAEETFELSPILANADRIIADATSLETAVSNIDLQELESSAFRDISDALSSYPGIASYRRTHATSAHPTTQGVRIRNLGASATSRALVLYNGVPQNDPFGAWVYWHQFDLSQMEAISVHPSGIGEVWGNMASGGLVSLISQASSPGASLLQTSVGTSDRFELRANSAQAIGEDAVFDFGIRHFQSDGFYTLRSDQRGSVDQPANSKATSANARISWQSGQNWISQIALRAFEEKRGNGTAVAQNQTKAFDLSLISERELASRNARINLNLYLQDREFQNVFSAVAVDRNSERAALDQYDVPALSIGGALVYREDEDQTVAYSAGIDFRFIDGSVNERFRNLGSGFTRDRFAGGKQSFIGAFTKMTVQPSEQDKLSITARIDQVENTSGRRVETDTVNDTVLRSDSYPDRQNSILSGNISWRHQFSDTTSTRASLFSGFRAPTLNELYRPFRVRNDITEANPKLANERHQGIELSLSKELGDDSSLRLSGFHYEAHEMIANALFTTASGFDPRFGFIPAGGSGSARVNIDQSTVSGIELHLQKSFTDTLHASITAVYSRTEIDSDERSELQENQFPQSPPWKAVASFDWEPNESLSLWTRYRWADRSFEDLGNTTRLGATADLSFGASYQIDESKKVSFSLNNALDEESVTGIANNGLVTIDEPRELLLTFTFQR